MSFHRTSISFLQVLKSSSFLNGPSPASFCLFSFFSNDKYSTNTINEKSVDGVLGTRTGAAGW